VSGAAATKLFVIPKPQPRPSSDDLASLGWLEDLYPAHARKIRRLVAQAIAASAAQPVPSQEQEKEPFRLTPPQSPMPSRKSHMRGSGTLYLQKGSRFLWMQYWRDGARHRESTGCEKPKAAQEVLRAKMREIDVEKEKRRAAGAGGAGRTGAQLCVRDLYESLERDYVINQRKSLKDLKIRWRKHLEESFAALPIASVTAELIAAYVARRLEEEASNATVNRELAALKRCYKLAIQTGRLKFGEQPYFPMLKERNVRKGFVKDAQYAALVRGAAAIGPWMRTLFELAYTYGWRKSELLGLRVGQVDMAERTITLDVGETKNDEARSVEMTATLVELLRSAIAGKGSEDKVITRGPGKPVRDFRRAWERATAAAGRPGLLFHDLRRSGVRNLVRAGVTEKVAMTISGHKTRSVFERYNIVSPTDIRKAVGLVDKAASRRRQEELFGEQAELPLQPES
jgi:integrase